MNQRDEGLMDYALFPMRVGFRWNHWDLWDFWDFWD